MRHGEWDLPLIWAGIIGIAVALYVILDGFDLGVGILFPFSRDEKERDQMISSIAPFWDGNETWLVLGGGGLWVAFPRAYAVIMSALYLPVIVMLLALVFRGVAFEFRTVAETSKRYWNFAFTAGSTLAAICQGVILGALIQGINVEDGAFAGGAFDWATPFALMCGLGVLAGYGLLGATWLVMKTDGEVAARAKRARQAAAARRARLHGAGEPVDAARLRADRRRAGSRRRTSTICGRCRSLTALTAFALWRWLEAGREMPPFLAAIALFLFGYAGIVISVFPYLVPPSLTIWDTAAAPASQTFMLVGTLVLLPIILGYFVFVFWIFRGKVRHGESYHH